MYEGEYRDGLKHGHGSIKFAPHICNGDSYVGQFAGDCPHGLGTSTSTSTGEKRTGVHKDGELQDGPGKVESVAGRKYTCNLKSGKIDPFSVIEL